MTAKQLVKQNKKKNPLNLLTCGFVHQPRTKDG